MDPEFWHERWQANQIGFHQAQFNALMVDHFQALDLQPGAHIFAPLCGKSRDLHWLAQQGFEVVGSELSAIAIDQLYADMALSPATTTRGAFTHYKARGIEAFVGDVFALTTELLGTVDATFDRAALVALPAEMRLRYAAHIQAITRGAPQFLLTFDYDQSRMEGPPFSVDQAEVHRVYGAHYRMSEIARRDVEGGLKGFCPADEIAWLLR